MRVWAIVVGAAVTAGIVVWSVSYFGQDMGMNRSAAKGTLSWISTAQEQFKQAAMVDLDGDKVGEYGFFSELAGTLPARSGKRADSPFVATELGTLRAGGIAEKSGYYFRLYLPTAKGPAIAEPGDRKAPAAVKADADAQEERWCCYAWPVEYGRTGTHVVYRSSTGMYLESDNAIQQYSGLSHVPAPEAAFRSDEKQAANLLGGAGLADSTDPHSKAGEWIAPKVPAHDGEIWYPGGA